MNCVGGPEKRVDCIFQMASPAETQRRHGKKRGYTGGSSSEKVRVKLEVCLPEERHSKDPAKWLQVIRCGFGGKKYLVWGESSREEQPRAQAKSSIILF